MLKWSHCPQPWEGAHVNPLNPIRYYSGGGLAENPKPEAKHTCETCDHYELDERMCRMKRHHMPRESKCALWWSVSMFGGANE